MSRKQGKEEQSRIKIDDSVFVLFNQEVDSINESVAIINDISKKYSVDFDQVGELLRNKEKYIFVLKPRNSS